MGDACDHLGAPDLHPTGEILRGLDVVSTSRLWLILPVQGEPHLTLVIRECQLVGTDVKP